MIGQVASDALLLAAAARSAQPDVPPTGRRRAVDWAERPARAKPPPRPRGRPGGTARSRRSCAAATVALYADSIGDVEQTLAGEEDALDVYLKKTPGSDPYDRIGRPAGSRHRYRRTFGARRAARRRLLAG